MATSKKKVSKKEAKSGPDNSAAGMKALAKELKKGVSEKKKTTKKKVTGKKKATPEPVKMSKTQRQKAERVTNKKLEDKMTGLIVVGSEKVLLLNPRNIVIDPDFNSRIDKGDIAGLQNSIKQNGVKVPIMVFKVGKHFELIAGERRLTCALKLGLKTIPATEQKGKLSKADLIALHLIENDGKPFAPVEEADSFRRLINEGWTARQISVAVGKSLRIVKDRLTLISAHPDVAKAVKSGKLSVGLGVVIAKKAAGSKRKQKALTKKATGKKKDAAKKVASSLGRSSLKTKLEKRAVNLRNRLDKLVGIVNKTLKGKKRVPKQLSGQIPFFSRHTDKLVRAAFVAGGSEVIHKALSAQNTRTQGKKKGRTASGKSTRQVQPK